MSKDVHPVFERRAHPAIPRNAQGPIEPNDCKVSGHDNFVNDAIIVQSAIGLRKYPVQVLAYLRAVPIWSIGSRRNEAHCEQVANAGRVAIVERVGPVLKPLHDKRFGRIPAGGNSPFRAHCKRN
jgi:hypothetical protein